MKQPSQSSTPPDVKKTSSKHEKSHKASAGKKSYYQGIQALLDKNARSLVSLPMLEAIYEKFIKLSVTALRQRVADDLHLEGQRLRAMNFGDHMEAIAQNSMFVIFKIMEFEELGLIAINKSLVYYLLDLLFGGRKLEPSLTVEGRQFTSIEYDMVKSFVEILLDNLGLAFEMVAPLQFRLERIENDSRFAQIIKPQDIAMIFNIHAHITPREGELDIIFPYTAIEPLYKLLSQPFIPEKIWHDPVWFKHMEKSIANVNTKLQVELRNSISKMEDLMNLKVGHTLVLDKFADDEVDVTINGVKVTTGKLGKIGDKIAVQLVEDLDIGKFNNLV